MTAYNIVRFRVKPGKEAQFIELQKKALDNPMPGGRKAAMIKTGDRSYCLVAEWDSFDAIVKARPQMIGYLNEVRDLLEDLGNGLGVTDPVSGETVFES